MSSKHDFLVCFLLWRFLPGAAGGLRLPASTFAPTGNKQAREGELLHGSQVCLGYGREAALPGHPWRQGVLHHQVGAPGSLSHPQTKGRIQIWSVGSEKGT